MLARHDVSVWRRPKRVSAETGASDWFGAERCGVRLRTQPWWGCPDATYLLMLV